MVILHVVTLTYTGISAKRHSTKSWKLPRIGRGLWCYKWALLIIRCKYNGSLNSFKNHLYKLASGWPNERVVFISTETSSDLWFFCYNLTATPVLFKEQGIILWGLWGDNFVMIKSNKARSALWYRLEDLNLFIFLGESTYPNLILIIATTKI